VEACGKDAEANGEKRRQIYIEKKDESEKLVACNTAVGSMAEEPLEGHVSSPPLQISREGDLRIAWKLELSFSRGKRVLLSSSHLCIPSTTSDTSVPLPATSSFLQIRTLSIRLYL